MQGVEQGPLPSKLGPGKGWQVGRWGRDLYQNMIFGGVWASRLRMAMTDAGEGPARAYTDIEVPEDGVYKVWAKYEAPPFFNYAFGLRLQNAKGKPVFDKVYGLLEAPKHFSYCDKLSTGSRYWSWGLDHDAAEGYEVKLTRGRYRLVMYKTVNPPPAGGRSVDAILITSDLSPLSAPKQPRYPLLDELRRANHVYFRFRNLSDRPARIQWNHWNHRYPDFYAPLYREQVRFFDAQGRLLPSNPKGDWPEPVAAGQASVWYDLGPTMNTESSSPFKVKALPLTGKPTDPSLPVAVDIALSPQKILKSFELGPGEAELTFLVQPDLQREEGVATTLKLTDIYRDITAKLNAEPRLGPIPKKLRLFAQTSGPGTTTGKTWDFAIAQEYRLALGLNTLHGPLDKAYIEAVIAWWAPHGGIVERSLAFQHSQDPAQIAARVIKAGVGDYFHYLSFGDEIGLPPVDGKDSRAFHEFVRSQGQSPSSLGMPDWEAVRPLSSLSLDVAVQTGVLPNNPAVLRSVVDKLKRLYWFSLRFRVRQGVAIFAAKTRALKEALGEQVETSANLGSMHPFYWMHQAAFIEAFKGRAMSLAWSEDYTYCQPEASRLVVDLEAAYLRKGASYHDTPQMFYCMPHYPGNTPEHLLQNAVMLWAQNVKDLDFFIASPDAWSTENYITYRGGLPTFKTLRTISGMAGRIENDLLPARPDATPVAMLVSESSDVWELEGRSQGDVQPGSRASNVSQEERKNLWYALRLAGYRVDLVTEDDMKEGLLKNYRAVYMCGHNLERLAAEALKDWVTEGGVLFATAGAARRDEFDEPLTELDPVLGRGAPKTFRGYRGPLRAKLELLFEKTLDRAGGVEVLCSKETFEPAAEARVLARYDSDNQPAWVKHTVGKGVAYYSGILPGQAFVKPALPVQPAGKGGPYGDFEPVNFDPAAQSMILRPLQDNQILPDVSIAHRGVVAGRLSGPTSTVLPLVNLAEQHDGRLHNLKIVLTGVARPPQRVWSCFYPKGLPFKVLGHQVTITLPALQTADVIVLSQP